MINYDNETTKTNEGKKVARQGDIAFVKQDILPSNFNNLKPMEIIDDRGLVLALGEVTGHRHILLDATKYDARIDDKDPNILWLNVKEPTYLVQEGRESSINFKTVQDMHAPIKIMPGVYRKQYELDYNIWTDEEYITKD